jgi:class 3 adenylate cyclase/pimeloyl-ACP methyl ester carboxylesterase
MEPRIQYARTSDDVGIAYADVGSGTALLTMPGHGFSHAELNWTMYAKVVQPLASRFRTIWYDARGTGLSDRGVIDFSIEAMIRDLEAVVARTGSDSFVLAAWTHGAPIAVTYAAAHPERVSHLILCDAFASFSDFSQSPGYRAYIQLRDTDWEILTETFAQVLWAFDNPEYGRPFAEFMRASVKPEALRAVYEAQEKYEVTDLLPKIAAPTLVVHNRNNRWSPLTAGQRIAATIPNARLASIDDFAYAPVPALIEDFVLGEHAPAAPAVPNVPSGTAVIMFADIADSTALTERLGDIPFRARARDLDGALRTVIRDLGGTPIDGKLLGDGILAVFTSAREGIAAALVCATAGGQAGLPLHLGLHAGDVIREDNNVYGGAVNIASRISGLSAPGEVLVSDTVRSLARTSAGVGFEDRGEQALKGVGEAVRVWAVVQGDGADSANRP